MLNNIYEYVGAIHIHSNYSDGLCSIKKIAKIAKSQRIDYLLFSDHMTLQPLVDGLEGWFDDKVLILIGYEIEDPSGGNHYLVFGLLDPLPSSLEAEEYVYLVKEKKGIGFIAHPDSNYSDIKIKRPSWSNWKIKGFDGIEIWCYMSDWLRNFRNNNIFNFLVRFFFSDKFLRGPCKSLLSYWDKVVLQNKVVAIGGLDVHSYRYKLGPFKLNFLSYKKLFKTIRTHILLKEPLPKNNFLKAKTLVYEALAKGNSFIANNLLGNARGFRFFIKSDADNIAKIGDGLSFRREALINISSPLKAKIFLLSNRKIVKKFYGNNISFYVSESGCYRVEAYRKDKLWVLTNHIILNRNRV